MEGIWNYYYWQALATNAFDPVGHILRISATLDLAACSNYQKTITAQTRKCNRWLGPYQPGVNAPDPTEIPGEEGEPTQEEAAPATTAVAEPPPPAAGGAQTSLEGGTRQLLDYLLMP
jgi:hypothetical protein